MTEAWNWLRAHPREGLVAAGVVTALLVGSFAAGRWAAPTKVEERERVVERQVVDEKAVAKAVSDARTTWEREVVDHTRVETRYVDGKPSVRIEYRDRDSTSSGGKVETKTVEVVVEKRVEVVKEVEKERIVTRDPPRVALFATVGLPFSAGGLAPPQYGLTATARVLGPISVLAAGSGGVAGGQGTVGVGLSW